ncbi:MAG: SET domain-containing protein [Gemmatimonadaceae bacterium]
MQNGKKPNEQPFEIRRSAIQGRGGFAMRRITKGERVIEYTGERISWKEADRRYDDDAMKRHHTFLFTLTRRTCVDAAVGGNDARFINHSCDPNCEAVIVNNRIYIEALRDIASGEELSYDYAYERDADSAVDEEKLYVCRCGTKKCRGTILVPAKEPVSKVRHSASRHAAQRRHRALTS